MQRYEESILGKAGDELVSLDLDLPADRVLAEREYTPLSSGVYFRMNFFVDGSDPRSRDVFKSLYMTSFEAP